ncbi:cytochrome P450 [Streptomyces lasalocidi]
MPESDVPAFRGWSDTLVQTADTADLDTVRAAKNAMEEYFTELIALRQREPEDSLLSELIHKRDTDDALTTSELQGLAQVILLAGLETTVNQIGVGVVWLLSRPEHWERTVADPGLIPATVEELLRIEPVAGDGLPGVPRYTTRAVELGGHTIPSDTIIWVDTAQANLDEAKFACPHAFDLNRGANQHLAFGHGIHHCLGAHLARVQVQTVFAKLVEMVPALRLAVDPGELTITSGTAVRGYRHIPVAW